MTKLLPLLSGAALALGLSIIAPTHADARYTGTQNACVTGVQHGDRLSVRTRPTANSRRKGWLARTMCGMGIESVEGNWTYVRTTDFRGRRIQGWVNNRFLRSANSQDFNPTPPGSSAFPVIASTGGGIVRSRPNINSRKITSLREFERITVIENTGVMFNGYPWFKIRYRGGRRGFQWGGIICSEAVPFEGTFDTCANFRNSLAGNNTGGNNNGGDTSRRVRYNCNEGIPLNVTFVRSNGSSYALYSHDSGPQIRVEGRAPSGSTFFYGNGYHELRGRGNQVSLFEGGQPIDACFAN